MGAGAKRVRQARDWTVTSAEEPGGQETRCLSAHASVNPLLRSERGVVPAARIVPATQGHELFGADAPVTIQLDPLGGVASAEQSGPRVAGPAAGPGSLFPCDGSVQADLNVGWISLVDHPLVAGKGGRQ